MQLQRFPLLLGLPFLISLSSCLIVPIGGGQKEIFVDDNFAFIEIGKTTKEEIATAMSDFPMERDEGEVRVILTPQEFRGGDWWLYSHTRKEAQWMLIGGESGITFGDEDYRFLLIKFDNEGIVADYELSSAEHWGCNQYGVCKRESRVNLLASENEDLAVKQFDIAADRCGVYVYVNKLVFESRYLSGMPILLDGHPIGWLLDEKQFIFWQLNQGVHQLQSGHEPDSGGQWFVAQQSIEFNCAAGGLYFFELKDLKRMTNTVDYRMRFSLDMELVDVAKGREAIDERQLTLNVDQPSE